MIERKFCLLYCWMFCYFVFMIGLRGSNEKIFFCSFQLRLKFAAVIKFSPISKSASDRP